MVCIRQCAEHRAKIGRIAALVAHLGEMQEPQALVLVLALARLIAVAGVAAKRLSIAAPIVLIVAGTAVSFIPNLPGYRSIPS